MNLFKLTLPAALSAALLFAAPAYAKEDASHFLVTPALIQKLKNAEADMKAAHKPEDEKDVGDDDQTIEGAVKRVDKDPRTRAILAKHGITSRELVLASFAMVHAGMFVATEASMDPKARAKAYDGYTKEQKANIATMRAFAAQKKK